METITFKHSGNAGDCIYSLDIVSRAFKTEGKVIYYIHLNQPSGFTDKEHPLGQVMMNQTMYDLLKPLLMDMPFIEDVQIYDGQKVDYNLDLFRKECRNLSAGNIIKWYDVAFPEVITDFKLRIKVDPIPNDYIIVNRTTRYNNFMIDYSVLKNYDNVYFVGTPDEFRRLSVHNSNIKHLIVQDFLELARYIQGCKLFIGNQSMAFAIAEMLEVDRVLEQYYLAPNVIPEGGRYYVFHTNEQFKRILSLSLPYAEYKDKDRAETGEKIRTTQGEG